MATLKYWDGTAWQRILPSSIGAEPVGTIMAWPVPSPAAPAGYLVCDGATYDRAAYNELFAVIGTTFGAGGTELLTANQASMETNVNDWSFNNAFGTYGNGLAKAQSNVRALAGTYSLLATCSAHANGNWMMASTTVTVGTKYHISVWVYVPAGGPDVRLTDTFNFSGPWVSVKDSWTELTYEWTATGTALQFGVHAKGPTTDNQQFWVDKASVTSTATAVFQVPDMRNRTVVGSSSTKPVGSSGGSETHILTKAETPSVTGEVAAHGGRSNFWNPLGAFSTSDMAADYGGVNPTSGATSVSYLRFNNNGQGLSHNNMQPFAAMSWVIKYTKAIAGPDTNALDWYCADMTAVGPLNTTTVRVPILPGQGTGITNTGGALYPNRAGTYAVEVNVSLQGTGTGGPCNISLRHMRGSTQIRQNNVASAVGGMNDWAVAATAGVFDMQAGDYVEVTANCNVSSNINVYGGNCNISMNRLAGAGPPGPQGPAGVDTVEWGAGSPASGALPVAAVIFPITAASFRGLGCTLVPSGPLIGTIQCNKAGTYRVSGNITAQGTNGWVVGEVVVYRGGVGIRSFAVVGTSGSGGGYGECAIDSIVDLAVGDSVGLVGTAGAAGVTIDGRSHLAINRLAGAGPKGDKGDAGTITDSGWITPTLNSGWEHYDQTEHGPICYRKIGGVVYIRGLGKKPSAPFNVGAFTLPAGFRPAKKVLWSAATEAGARRYDIESNGNVLPADATGVGANMWWSFIATFPADQ